MEEFDSLLDAMKFADFPIVGRLHDTSEFGGKDLIEGKEVLIESQLKIKYAQIKVLDFDNKEEIQDEKGIEFIMEHDNCVGNTFLIPSKYTTFLRFILKPGSRKRYATIYQVLQELPRFILVCEETIALPLNGIGKNIVIPENTCLEVIRKFSLDGITYLECSDGKNLFSFRETDRVNFTAMDDERLYQLYELTRFKLLPRPFQFQNVEPEDILHTNEELNSSLLTAAEGPLELIRFIDVDVVVGWLRDNSNKTYKTFIIPRRLLPLIKLQTIPFPNQNIKDGYVKRRYNKCTNSEFVERKLYEMQVNETKIIWLASPDLYKRNYFGNRMFDVDPIDFKDSDEDDDGMFDCPPPIPDRPSRHQDQCIPAKLLVKVKEKKTLFSKVHQELLKWFLPKRSPKSDQNERKEITLNNQQQENHSITHQSIQRNRNNLQNDIRITNASKRYKKRHDEILEEDDSSQYLHTVEDSEDSPQPPQLIQPTMKLCTDLFSPNFSVSESYSVSNSDTSDSESSRDYDYIESELFDFSIIASPEHKADLSSVEVEIDKLCMKSEINTFDVQDIHQNIHKKEESRNVENLDRFSPTEEQLLFSEVEETINKMKMSLSPEKRRQISEPDQSEKEKFYKYTVVDTAKCFKLCGLDEFAHKCEENKLDGSFFRNFDLQCLKEDPFYCTSFHLIMIRKIIFEGWRPKI